MAKVAITESYLEDIADAIRAKTGLSTTYKPSQMATAISSIPSGGGIIPTGTIQITSNNTYDVTQYASAAVNVPTGSTINNQDKTVSPSESQQTVEADSGYTGLGTVTVNAISSSYVGSGITRRTSSDLTVNGGTITAPSGYYSSSASQSVSSMSLPTSTSASATSGYTSKATVSRSTSDQYINIPTGYNSAGVYYKINAVPNGTAGTPTATKGNVSNNSISVTPSVTNTTGYITGSTKTGTAVSVSASELVSGNKSITSNGTNIDVTNYATVSVNVSGGGSSPVIQELVITPTESQQVFDGTSTLVSDASRFNSTTETVTLSNQLNVGTTYYYVYQYGSESQSMSGNLYEVDGTFTCTSSLQTIYNWVQVSNTTAVFLTSEDVAILKIYTPVVDGYLPVTINAISSTYVGSGIAQRGQSDLTASGATVTVPAGYYSSQFTKTIGSGYVTAPASISGTSATLSTGTGTLTLTKTIQVTPNLTTAGYISTGVPGDSSVSLTASVTIDPTPTASGATVTIPAGYYSSQTTKSVTTMSLPTAASASATSGYTSKATISRSTSDQYINIPPGYNSAGGYYKINAVANGSVTGPSSLSGSSATVTTGTNTITLTKTGVSTTPTISAGYISSATSSTATVTLTASVTTKAATTYNTSSSDQTIASGTYLTGTQTIKAVTVSGLSADKILSGTTVKIGDANDDDRIASVSGSVTLTTVYTGSSAPSSALGSNNDIYIQS